MVKILFTICVLLVFALPCRAEKQFPDGFIENVLNSTANVLTSPARIGLNTVPYLTIAAAGIPSIINNDVLIYRNIQNSRSYFLDQTVPAVNLLGDGYVHLALCGGLMLFGNQKDKDIGTIALEGYITASIITRLGKIGFSATRPGGNNSEHKFFQYINWNGSFPSGHTTLAFTQAAIFGEFYHIEYITYPLALLAGLSRIYLGEHWPSDVLAGALLGYLTGTEIIRNHKDQAKINSWRITPFIGKDEKGIIISYLF